MTQHDFRLDADLTLPPGPHAWGCGCSFHARRRFGAAALAGAGLLAVPAWAREGVDVGKQSVFAGAVSAETVEAAAVEQYNKLKQEAASKNALAPAGDAQVVRLRTIAERIIPFSYEWNPRAKDWKWEINLLGSSQINAFCMPGGKIAFFYGILQQLQLDDNEVAMVMGHEISHALREHARVQMGKTAATRGAIAIGAAIFGLGDGGRMLADIGGQLVTMKFGRDDETEADLVGMELAARAGYNPRAGVTLWNKMAQASKGAPPQFLSTHPSGPTRIRDIEVNLPKVEGLYARAPKPERRFEPPKPAAKK